MTIKKIITGGCSFSDEFSRQTWPHRLANVVHHYWPNIEFRHTGMSCQGQELIQKKLSLALMEELEYYKPEELLVLPMWSGTERKTFWVDNLIYVEEIAKQWQERSISWALQFGDLYGRAKPNTINRIHIKKPNGNGTMTQYSTEGGWYHCNYLSPDSKLTDEFFKSCNTLIGYTTTSLENIIILQNLCKIKGVQIYQSFYRSYVYEDIYQNKNHLNLNYLFKQWDLDTIVSTTGIYEHLRPVDKDIEGWKLEGIFQNIFKVNDKDDRQYFESDNWHPNIKGSSKWVNEVLFPFLTSKNLFK
jgi:hypothetical protein